MTQKNRTARRSSIIEADTGSGAGQVAAHPHDSGSQANETVDGLDATTESFYGTPAKIRLPGQAPAMSKKRPYLTGLVKHQKSRLAVFDRTEAAD
jgi:hypothetical protein